MRKIYKINNRNDIINYLWIRHKTDWLGTYDIRYVWHGSGMGFTQNFCRYKYALIKSAW